MRLTVMVKLSQQALLKEKERPKQPRTKKRNTRRMTRGKQVRKENFKTREKEESKDKTIQRSKA
jgi:hypothetical protein